MISKNQIKYIHQFEQKKFRRREGLFLAEGSKVVGDLLELHKPNILFATAEWLNTHTSTLTSVSCEIIEVSEEELRKLSLQQHPQQVLGLFPIPSAQKEFVLDPSSLALALDGIQDPGNLGTIIRIADWFGIQDIYCSEDTVDAWNPKVIQATMGSIARVNIAYTSLTSLLDTMPEDFPVYGTLLDGENIYTQELSEGGLIIMGNEGNGISEAIKSRVTRRLLIPDFRHGDTADSLNVAVATAITCSEFRRRSV